MNVTVSVGLVAICGAIIAIALGVFCGMWLISISFTVRSRPIRAEPDEDEADDEGAIFECCDCGADVQVIKVRCSTCSEPRKETCAVCDDAVVVNEAQGSAKGAPS